MTDALVPFLSSFFFGLLTGVTITTAYYRRVIDKLYRKT